MKREERDRLRAAATRALDATLTREGDRQPSDWQLQTSNSFRRIGTQYGDGDVLCGTKHHLDGHPDLLAKPGVLDYLVAAQPRVVLQLLDYVDALEDNSARASTLSSTQLLDMATIILSLCHAVRQIPGNDLTIKRAQALVDQLAVVFPEIRR